MGKQSARMVYRGKDHKDIYFRGKYHDAMYVGSELVWHKIKQEGYYVFIYVRNIGNSSGEKMAVSIFDEKSLTVQNVLEVIRNPESDASNAGLMSTTDGEKIYLSTLGEEALIASSIDGIHYGNTNLDYIENRYMFPYGSNYFTYTEEKEGITTKKNCMWGLIGTGPLGYTVSKNIITENNNVYSKESKSVGTGLSASRIDSDRIEETNNFYLAVTSNSKIAWHEKMRREKTGEESVTYTIKYYDVEKEMSGEIVEFKHRVGLSKYWCINGVYLFFVQTKSGNPSRLYIYYSFDGVNYDHSLIIEKYEHGLSDVIPFPIHVLYRMGIYYIYCSKETSLENAPCVLFMTTDFKHFPQKYIPSKIEISGKTFDTVGITLFEESRANEGRIYFYNGEMCTPEDGIVGSTKIGMIYIDNMFFRKSSGNKIINLP